MKDKSQKKGKDTMKIETNKRMSTINRFSVGLTIEGGKKPAEDF
ncbi:hypothetical protein [Methanolapillus africanus]